MSIPQSQSPTAHPQWAALQALAGGQSAGFLRSSFAGQPDRARQLSASACGLHLDYSKQRLGQPELEQLLGLAAAQQLPEWIAAMFAGEAINQTEQRAVLHSALRAPASAQLSVGGAPVAADVHEVLRRMRAFCEQVHQGQWLGYSGLPLTDVVNIGIGGSDLGPRMVCAALADRGSKLNAHFISNVDGAPMASLLARLNPATTLFIVTSKTFTTQETMANAAAARRWLVSAGGEAAVPRHFVAVSTNAQAVEGFGISADNMFGFWDWVGGRYSLWSAVGLSIALNLGFDQFEALLAGAHAMDEHFRSAPLAENLPVLAGLIGVWNRNFLGLQSQVIAPYAQALEKFPAWLQQLEMESNGKAVARDGSALDYATTPALWGDVGTNAQHAFFQMLHQGPQVHPVDLILVAEAGHELREQHQMLLANGLAQSAALAFGKDAQTVREELSSRGMTGAALEAAIPHRCFAGDRPSSSILLQRLDATQLGALLALYEHRSFVQSVIWNINAFDQWGVELGKQLAGQVLAAMQGGPAESLDSSTRALMNRVR